MQSAYRDCCSVVLDKFLQLIKRVANDYDSTEADEGHDQIKLAIEFLLKDDKEALRKVIFQATGVLYSNLG